LLTSQTGEANKHSFKQKTIRIFLLFLATYIIICGFVVIFPYVYYDSDSSAYSSIGQKLAFLPLSRWCAPEWGGHGGNVGYFQDHPPGILWLTAIFVRLGAPGPSAALWANFLYIFLSFYFVYLLASRFGGPMFGWSAVFAFTFTPIFLQYLVRANQEHPLNLAVVAGIYGFVRCRESWRYKAIFVFSLVVGFLIKGISGLAISLVALICWVILFKSKRTLFFIILAHLIALAAMALFELWYEQVTGGIPFWRNYFSIQLGSAVAGGFNPLAKIYNFIWYLGRAVWFPAPWVFFIFYGLFKWIKGDRSLFKSKFFLLSLGSAFSIIFWFSLFNRKADRYIFPAYIFLALAGVFVLFQRKTELRHWLERKKNLLPLYHSVILILIVLLRILVHNYLYIFIKLWPG
jgi:4-amino-4-deoxy-L-arabinose transferase-like glycosyltransferase